ncbi:MAG: 16S rRNA (uracil(1498)-N(3))-methyltransferase [Gammaproteobacteria bacterium]|nr:16S rRNA (uracil(1498)-N(3))-methyltransferase [Gammaproteobacteria bacterium]
MIRLYQSTSLTSGQDIHLDKNPSHHLIRVLRTKKGTDIILFNGDGYEYLAETLDENHKHCQVTIKQKIKIDNESSLNITLLQGISRGDRMDISIQKSTELGIQELIPVNCQRSGNILKGERAEKKLTHWQQISISASEQSGRCIIPTIKPTLDFKQAIQTNSPGHKIILVPGAKKSITTIPKPDNKIFILIGPEGGFTKEEIQLAADHGFIAISLGPRILRTETAGPACIAAAQTLWGDFS